MSPIPPFAHRLFALMAMVWVGSQLTIGYAVAPVLFTSLDPMTAGSIAAKLFHIEGWIGAGCAVLMIALANLLVRRGAAPYRLLRWLLVGMLLCVLIGYFALQPYMNALRLQATGAGVDIANSPYAHRFGVLHGISSVFYLIESLLGVTLVWLHAGAWRPGAAS